MDKLHKEREGKKKKSGPCWRKEKSYVCIHQNFHVRKSSAHSALEE